MNLELESLDGQEVNSIGKFTVDDMKSISFMIENDSDISLHSTLLSKITTECRSFDKFNILLNARIKYVDQNIVFNNGQSNITYNLELWSPILEENYRKIATTLDIDNITISLDYPLELYFDTREDAIRSCIVFLKIGNTYLEFPKLTKSEQLSLLDKLPCKVIDSINDFIEKNSEPIILLPSRMGLPEISINFFDNSAFSILKMIYNYYSYEDILEIIFVLSKRIPDAGFLMSSIPRDISFMSKLYTEELEKPDTESN